MDGRGENRHGVGGRLNPACLCGELALAREARAAQRGLERQLLDFI